MHEEGFRWEFSAKAVRLGGEDVTQEWQDSLGGTWKIKVEEDILTVYRYPGPLESQKDSILMARELTMTAIREFMGEWADFGLEVPSDDTN